MILLILLLINISKTANGYILSSSNCPQSCSCSLASNVLTISSCNQSSISFTLPSNFSANAELSSVTEISAPNCLIQSFPENICQYSGLTILDLSYNQIRQLNNSNFKCLKNLSTLRLNNNLISSINSDSFSNLTNLNYLYLENNKLTDIPNFLFYKHLVNLRTIDLSSNLLTTMELWPTYLPSIITINLKYNMIQNFTNKFSWFLAASMDLPAFNPFTVIDLEYNNITSLDDRTIQQYGICSFNDYSIFLNKYFSVFWLDNNPTVCSCSNSQRLVKDSIIISSNSTTLSNSKIFSSFCRTPALYAGKRLLIFDICTTNISYPYCIIPTQLPTSFQTNMQTTATSSVPIKLVTTPTATKINSSSNSSIKTIQLTVISLFLPLFLMKI